MSLPNGKTQARWDKFYQERAALPYPAPDPLLLQYVAPATHREARALDLACGVGQNGLWLATQGYLTDLYDISRAALERARAEATQREIRRANFLLADLERAVLPEAEFDLVICFRYLQRDLFPRLRASVKPGGRLVYQTFNVGYLAQRPTFNPDYVLQLGELAGVFADWQMLRAHDGVTLSDIIAIKPQQDKTVTSNG